MDEGNFGSVKAAINRYGGRINRGTDVRKKFQKDASNSERSDSKAPELHLAKKKIDQINENRKMAETVKSQAELELLNAKKLVRELSSQIEESKLRAREKTEELQTLNKVKRVEDKSVLETVQMEDNCYLEVVGELEVLKQELSKIKLDMARALEEKSYAEKEADSAVSRLRSYMSTAEQLRREIEEANEEEVLVELAQIQARKELAAVEAQRKEEAENFSSIIQEIRKKIRVLKDEIEQAKDLESKLAITNSDADVLQNELKLIKEMDKRSDSSALLENSELRSITEDLEAARKELASIKPGVFQLMTSMDLIRKELNTILKEKGRMEKLETKAEKSLRNLNSKLLRGKDKVEGVRTSKEKAELMLSNLSIALENIKKEKKEAEEEKERIIAETANVRDEIQRSDSKTDSTEEKLRAAMEELEAVKTTEANALKRLQALVEKAVLARASKNKSSMITISNFEYNYLTGSALGAKEIADKKAAASQAWAEALRANEKETKMKITLAERQIKELKQKEEQEFHRMANKLNAAELAETAMQKQSHQGNKDLHGRRSLTENSTYNWTPVRQTKLRRSFGSPAVKRVTTSTSLTMKKRRKAMLKIAKCFSSKQIENEKLVSLKES